MKEACKTVFNVQRSKKEPSTKRAKNTEHSLLRGWGILIRAVFGFVALSQVAQDLEDPFGTIIIIVIHTVFCLNQNGVLVGQYSTHFVENIRTAYYTLSQHCSVNTKQQGSSFN